MADEAPANDGPAPGVEGFQEAAADFGYKTGRPLSNEFPQTSKSGEDSGVDGGIHAASKRDDEHQELLKEHPNLLTEDEALAVAGETKDRRLSGAYHKGEAALNDEQDRIRSGNMSDDEKTQAEEDVNRRRSELRAMHGVNEKWIPSASAEAHRRAANEDDIAAEKVEQWALILQRSPELSEAGWDIHRVIEESYEAVMARQNADGVLMQATKLDEDLESGKINLVDLIQQTGSSRIFGKNIDLVLARQLTKLLSGDKTRTIQQVEDEFMKEVQKAVDAYVDIARWHEGRVRSLSQGKAPK